MIARNVWEAAHDASRNRSDTDQAIVKRLTHEKYEAIAKLAPWDGMRTTVTLDMSTAADSTGLWLPADLIGIEGVWDTVQIGLEYLPRDYVATPEQDYNYRYYFSQTQKEDLYSGETGLSITQRSSTLSFSSALAASAEGEYIRLGNEPGYYKITSSSLTAPTITPTYWGPTLNDVSYRIRPQGTRKLTLIGPGGAFMSSRSVVVHHWAYPMPLYRENDPVLLPSIEPLKLMVLVDYIGTYKKAEQRADRYRRELNGPDGKGGALADAVAMNPAFGRQRRTDDRINKPLFAQRPGMYKNYRTARG